LIRNYLLTAYRNIFKTKLFSAINIIGLSIGMAAFLLILHFVYFEGTYDKFHENYESVYRLRYERETENDAVRFASCCPPAGPIIREKYPEVEKLGRMVRNQATVSYGDIKFYEEKMFWAESEMLEVLKFPFMKGDVKEGLSFPGNAFISESTAKRYFGSEDPMGKTLSVDKKTDYQVAGIFKDIPNNSHIKFDILLSWENLKQQLGPDYYEAWGHTGSYTYLTLKKGTDPAALEQKLIQLIDESFGEVLREYKMTMNLPLQPLADIHLTSNFMQEYEANGSDETVNLLLIIAFFVIVMAWVNYINLSTARSLNRAKEVGLRKVVGASRTNLSIQFFIETALLNLISLGLSLLIINFLMPYFSEITGMPLSVSIWSQSWFIPALVGLFIIGVFFSGFYPVIALSSFQPVVVLKGKFRNSTKGNRLRKVLVVFQFAMAFLLITGTLTVYEQLSFMQNQELGFSAEQTLVLKSPRVRDDSYKESLNTFKEQLKNNTAISNVCAVTEVPGRQIYWDNGGIRKQGEDANKGKNYMIIGADYDFIDLFDLKMIAGRNFSREFPSDDMGLLLNETAVTFMGFENSEEAIGKKVDYWGNIYTIVGVVKDYHQQSLKDKYEPQLFRLMLTGRDVRGQIAVKMNTANVSETVDMVKEKYAAFFPGNPVEFFFLDEYYNQQYKSDRLLGDAVGSFATLAIIITSLGIFGLSLFSAVQRTKEIGIRKILGADIKRILIILSKDFILLMALSFILSLPLLLWGLNQFLDGYAYRMSLHIWLFALPMFLVLVITLITVGYHIVKAALTNPVNTLRYE